MSNELGERVASIEKTLEHHEKILDDFKTSDKALTRISALFELQVEENKKQNETMKSFSNTLQNVNENLSRLNNTQEKIQQELSEIGTRVEKVEDKQKANEDANTIELNGLSKKIILWIVGFGLIALTAYLLIFLGLK